MSFKIDQLESITVLRAQGDIMFGRGDIEMRDTVKAQLAEGHRRIVLDLSGVRIMDSAGLGELVASLKRVREVDGELKIFGISSRVSDALHKSRLVEILDIYSTEREAIAAFLH